MKSILLHNLSATALEEMQPKSNKVGADLMVTFNANLYRPRTDNEMTGSQQQSLFVTVVVLCLCCSFAHLIKVILCI